MQFFSARDWDCFFVVLYILWCSFPRKAGSIHIGPHFGAPFPSETPSKACSGLFLGCASVLAFWSSQQSLSVLVRGCAGGERGPWREVSLVLSQRIGVTRECCFEVSSNVGHSDCMLLLMTFFTAPPMYPTPTPV